MHEFSAHSQVVHNNGISVYAFLFPFQDTADLEEEAVHNYPFIFRTESAEQCQYHTMVERELVIISNDLVGAVINLSSAYYHGLQYSLPKASLSCFSAFTTLHFRN